MANLNVVNMAGQSVGSIELSDKLFGIEEINSAVLHAAVRMYLLNQRQGTQSALPVPFCLQGFFPPPETSERVRAD